MALHLRASSVLLGARTHTAAAARPAGASRRPAVIARAYLGAKGEPPKGGDKEPLPASLPHEGAAAGAGAVPAGEPLPAFPFARPAEARPPAEHARLLASACPARAALFDGTPVWLLAKMRDVKAALTDPRLSKVGASLVCLLFGGWAGFAALVWAPRCPLPGARSQAGRVRQSAGLNGRGPFCMCSPPFSGCAARWETPTDKEARAWAGEPPAGDESRGGGKAGTALLRPPK